MQKTLWFVLGAAFACATLSVAWAVGGGGDQEVRINARRLDDGRVEVALQQRSGGDWQRHLPSARFLPPDAAAGRWLSSGAVTLPPVQREQAAESGGFSNPATRTPVSQQAGADLFCLVTHERPGDHEFWNLIKQGARRYAELSGVGLIVYGSPVVSEQADLLRQCVADGADAIAATLADADGMAAAIAAARAQGIVVNSFNSGSLDFRRVGIATHVSIDDEAGGRLAARLFRERGVDGPILCVIHESRNAGLEERCDGLSAAHGASVIRFYVDETGVEDLDASRQAMVERISEADADQLAGVLTLNARIGLTALEAITAADAPLALATFDQTIEVLRAIQAGEVLFALDTIPWHQAWYTMSGLSADLYAHRILTELYGLEDPQVLLPSTLISLSPDVLTQANVGDWIYVASLVHEAAQAQGAAE